MIFRLGASFALVLLLSLSAHAQTTGDPILYEVYQVDETASIRLVDSVSGEIQEIATLNPDSADAGWSPDGRYVHLVEESGERLRSLRIYDRETETRYLITDAQVLNPCSDDVYWSPRGNALAYLALEVDLQVLHLVNADGSGDRVLVSGIADFTLPVLWSADGRYLTRAVTLADGYRYLIWEAASGRLAAEITSIAGDFEPVWSPTGARLALAGFQQDEILVFDSADEEITTYTGSPPAFWSPDGEILSLYRQREEGAGLLILLGVDGTVVWQSSGISVSLHTSVWSPDGRWLAFAGTTLEAENVSKPAAGTSYPEGTPTIYVFDRQTLTVRTVSHEAIYAGRMYWSPDSEVLVFGGNIDVFSDELALLWWYDPVNGTEQHVELDVPLWNYGYFTPLWSLDSRYLLYIGAGGFGYFDRETGTADFIEHLTHTFRWFPGADPHTFEAVANFDDLVVIEPDGRARNLTNTPDEREMFLGWAGDQAYYRSLLWCGEG